MTQTLTLRCKICNGTGTTRNPFFERCQDKFWREEAQGGLQEGDCQHCEVREICKEGEYTDCYNCRGQGKLTFHHDFWEVDYNAPQTTTA